MKWRVLLFAHLREGFGPSIEVEAEPTVDAVLASLKVAGIQVQSSRLAANNQFVRSGDALKAGQELSLIPPVSGG
jgi:molybdopterin converting factor small subunit